MKFRILLFSLLATAATISARAEKIEVPEAELARESVLPRFETPDSIKHRNITNDGKFELGGYYGWNVSEPIYNQSKVGAVIGYHWTESSSFILNYAKWFGGRNTQYTSQLQKVGNLDFTKTPNLDFSAYLDYEWEAYYGKISLTKTGTMNIFIYPLVGIGGTKYVNKFYPGANFGIGQKFFFTNNFALRADLKIQYEQGPSPFLGNSQLLTTSPTPDPGAFQTKWMLGTILDVGLIFLF